jgi:hypothetical protein
MGEEVVMTGQAAVLAVQFERAVAEFERTIADLSAEQWKVYCPEEQRTVGVLARHVAKGIPFEMDVFREIASGRQPSTITRADLAEMNAADSSAWADCDQDETLALLRDYAAAAAAEVRAWNGAQLARSGLYIADIGEPWTVEQWVERILVGHIHGHLRSIRAALASARAG